MSNLSVIAGLDPAIQTEDRQTLRFIMDARVNPAHDEVCFLRGRAMNLHRHGRACPGHPRLCRWIDCQDVDARHEAGHDEYDVIGLIQSPSNLNRNRSFFILTQAYEESSFFRSPVQMNLRAKSMNLNQKVRP